MGHAFVRCDVDMIDPKSISGKIVQNAPSLNKDLVSGSLLCSRRDELCSIRVQQNRGVETCTTGNLNTPVRAKTHRKMRIPTEKYFSDGVPSENNTQK